MYKTGITTIFTTSGNVCAHVSFRKHGSASGLVYGWTRLWNEIEFFYIFNVFILEIVKIWRSPYAHFNFMNLHINTDVLLPMHKAVSDSCPIKTYGNNQPHLTDNGHTKEAVTHP